MPTEAGLPGWFPEDFSTDPALLAAFEDDADWHSAGRKSGGRQSEDDPDPGTAGQPAPATAEPSAVGDLARKLGLKKR